MKKTYDWSWSGVLLLMVSSGCQSLGGVDGIVRTAFSTLDSKQENNHLELRAEVDGMRNVLVAADDTLRAEFGVADAALEANTDVLRQTVSEQGERIASLEIVTATSDTQRVAAERRLTEARDETKQALSDFVELREKFTTMDVILQTTRESQSEQEQVYADDRKVRDAAESDMFNQM